MGYTQTAVQQHLSSVKENSTYEKPNTKPKKQKKIDPEEMEIWRYYL